MENTIKKNIAPYYRRFCALLIDIFIIVAFIVFVTSLKEYLLKHQDHSKYAQIIYEILSSGFLELVIIIAYVVLSKGNTIAKRLLGLQVISMSGKNPDWKASIKRFAMLPIGLIVYFRISTDEARQGFHDKVAGTVVVMRREEKPIKGHKKSFSEQKLNRALLYTYGFSTAVVIADLLYVSVGLFVLTVPDQTMDLWLIMALSISLIGYFVFFKMFTNRKLIFKIDLMEEGYQVNKILQGISTKMLILCLLPSVVGFALLFLYSTKAVFVVAVFISLSATFYFLVSNLRYLRKWKDGKVPGTRR